MGLLLASFFAGILTVAAPCVFPLLPVIIGGSLGGKSNLRPLVITISLALSLVAFTLLLKVSAVGLAFSPNVWKWISGSIVIILGIAYIFPSIWAKIMHLTGMEKRSQEALQASAKREGIGGMILTGASLGPVFASCSPTYAYIIATVINESFSVALLNLFVYALGLALIMFAVAIFGRKLIRNATWAMDPKGWFRRGLGVLFVIVGLAIITGADKQFEAWVLDQGYFDLTGIEQQLLEDITENQ